MKFLNQVLLEQPQNVVAILGYLLLIMHVRHVFKMQRSILDNTLQKFREHAKILQEIEQKLSQGICLYAQEKQR